MSENEPAFPNGDFVDGHTADGPLRRSIHSGLTKREWFAGMAMCGMLSAGANWYEQDRVTTLAKGWADAMLSEKEAESDE